MNVNNKIKMKQILFQFNFVSFLNKEFSVDISSIDVDVFATIENDDSSSLVVVVVVVIDDVSNDDEDNQ